MKKDLPGLFANKIDKQLHNNEKVAITKNDDRSVEENKKTTILFEKSINQKIKEIFDSPKYVYKADVVIKLKDKTITKKIVGKNQNSLITMDNEIIPIIDIVDIKYKS